MGCAMYGWKVLLYIVILSLLIISWFIIFKNLFDCISKKSY